MKTNGSLPLESPELNKIFATFSLEDQLETLLDQINDRYDIVAKRVFVLESSDTPELVCTYGVDCNNLNDNALMSNTIMVHRKKEFNTLYSINGLNALIANNNGGKIDHTYKVNWSDYKNSLLLTRDGLFAKINTKVKDIVYLN